MPEASVPCPICHCQASAGVDAHRIIDALRDDDLDRAIEIGLLDAEPCAACTPACRVHLIDARDARLRALAARERYRARAARLARRAEERAAARATAAKLPSALPPAAAAALARAKAKARRP